MNNLPSILRSPMTWLIVLIVIAGAVVIAGGGDDGVDETAETAPVVVTGAALPRFSDPDTAAGLTIPTVEASLLDGGTTTIGPGDGTPRLLAFLAHWCPHCQAEVPVVRDWLATDPLPDGVEVLAISTAVASNADNYPPSEWFAREDWPTPVLVDDGDGSIANAFGLPGFPYWVAVDADGVVVARAGGEIETAQLDLLAGLAAGTTAAP